jgi:HAD superfamily hydrolase (TIGR01509 family)
MTIDTIIFDLDGVLVDTEQVWSDVRREFARAHGGHWTQEIDAPKVMGANSVEWAAAMRENNGVDLPVDEIYQGIVDGVKASYDRNLVIMPGAPAAIAALARDFRLGVASSSPLELIDYAVERAGLGEHFAALISSDEVGVGKPAPDVYQEACWRLGTVPARAAGVEDSTNGLVAVHAAGMRVIAIPHPGFPPAAEALGLADLVLGTIAELTAAVVAALGADR